MTRQFTLEYWIDDSWYVGRLREVPGVFSQGETLEELEVNIQDAYELMLQDEHSFLPPSPISTKEHGAPLFSSTVARRAHGLRS